MLLPLHSRGIFKSHDPGEARAFLAGKDVDLIVAPCGKASRSFHTVINGVYLSRLWLGYLSYGARVELRVPPSRGDYWVHFPQHSGFVASSIGQNIDCDASRGVVTSPSAIHVLRTFPDSDRLSLSIQREAIERHLAALLGDNPGELLEFSPSMLLGDGPGRSLAGFIRLAATEFECDGAMTSPLLANQFEQLILTALLTIQPSNYFARIGARERPIAPRNLRRAIEYIHGNIGEPITLADLSAVSGVAGRTLIKHFRDFKGIPPMRYVRNLRLESVQRELAAGTADNVTSVAIHWGFAHAGRFSIEYRKRFGESPSVTLARARARSD